MSKSFYNTIHSKDQMLMNFESKAEKQTDIIFHLFELNKYRPFTPFEIQSALLLKGHDYPITSIRRAITDLTDEGKLIKLPVEKMKTGNYGKPNHTWQYNENINQ